VGEKSCQRKRKRKEGKCRGPDGLASQRARPSLPLLIRSKKTATEKCSRNEGSGTAREEKEPDIMERSSEALIRPELWQERGEREEKNGPEGDIADERFDLTL